jgi:large subunit ribosomal protein L3
MISKIPAIKIGMTSAFDGTGTTVPVTLLRPLPLVVTEIKRPEKHGYAAVQVAFDEVTQKRVNKPIQGILKKAGIDTYFRHFFEVRVSPEELENYQLGQSIDPATFVSSWDGLAVTGTSKGKGFAGAVKRWGFAGQQRTHGDPDNRRPMSNNATDPARVFPGSRRPGRMGNKQITIKGVTLFEFNQDLGVLVVAGSLPGPNGGTLFVEKRSERAAEEEAE